jgi:hypothetical protein
MNEAIRLKPWEEACGTLQSVVEDCPYLTLDFGKFRVILAADESRILRDQITEELIGKRISVLRTDIPDKPALMRVV